MDSAPADSPEQPPRKKVRKGTRSCWECKHRKVRCHFASSDAPSCRECLSRGSVCRSQELPEPENPRESDRSSLMERMTRVESLLERVLQRLDNGDSVDRPSVPSPMEHSGRSVSPPAITPSATENAPVLSLFNNTVLGSHATGTPYQNSQNTADPQVQGLRASLLAFLPSQATVDKLADVNNCWWLMRVQCFGDEGISLLSKPVASLRRSNPVIIAKSLLWVALCIQQLPPGFDTGSLSLPCPAVQFTQHCMALVKQSVCCHDTMIRNVDGLECLVLQGIFYNNDGKLRRAWLSYRHALNIAQLLGLHRPMAQSQDVSDSLVRAKGVWRHIIFADRYLSLMLGMCHGIGDFALDPQATSNTPEISHMERLFTAAGAIIERNQAFSAHSPAMMRKTQTIDAELGDIDPAAITTDGIDSTRKTPELAQCYAKLMSQMWHFQLIAWLHLPFMLDSSTHKRYEYSRQTCLDASKHIITCYLAIRSLTGESFCCKTLDFQAFTAAATLLINQIGPDSRREQLPEESEAVDKVIQILDQLAQAQPDEVASRGLSVLQILKKLTSGQTNILPGETTDPDESRRLKLTIPYFGTIVLDRNFNPASAPESRPSIQAAPTAVWGTPTPYQYQDCLPNPVTDQLDDSNVFDDSGPDLALGFWSTDSNLALDSPFLAGLGGGLDWGFS